MTRELTNYTPGRLYPIAPPNLRLYAPGRLPDGTQAIIGKLPEGDRPALGPPLVDPLVGLFFSPDGRLLRHEFLPIPFAADLSLPLKEQIELGNRHRADARSRWMADLGMTAGTIRVLYFALPELRIGIADWPNHLFRERYAAAMRGEDLAELDAEDERHERWAGTGRFVFFWGNDFWMKPDGTIGSS